MYGYYCVTVLLCELFANIFETGRWWKRSYFDARDLTAAPVVEQLRAPAE
jgi:hypothetical protein